MTNNLHYIIREGKNQLKYWETEEPKCNGKPYCCEGKRCEWLQWKDLAKYKYVDIKPEFVEEIKNAAWFELETNDWQEFEKLAEKGIPLPESISKRVRLETFGEHVPTFGYDSTHWVDKVMVILTPIEPQAEENEAVLFAEWAFKSGYRVNAKGLYNHNDDFFRDKHYTTQELFNQFKLKNK